MRPSLLIIDTGGTFGKAYDPLRGTLYNPESCHPAETILASTRHNLDLEIAGMLHKDSLEITEADRQALVERIRESGTSKVLVVHGTDTMETTARYLEAHLPDRRIVLTGAMVPFRIDPVEATANLALGLGFIQAEDKPGVYIAMHGLARPHAELTKDRQLGRFVPA